MWIWIEENFNFFLLSLVCFWWLCKPCLQDVHILWMKRPGTEGVFYFRPPATLFTSMLLVQFHFSGRLKGNICPPCWPFSLHRRGTVYFNLTHYISVTFLFQYGCFSHMTRPSLTVGEPSDNGNISSVVPFRLNRLSLLPFSPPLHPQVILISEISVSFFLPVYVPVTRGNHGEGGIRLGVLKG